jgi:triphosphoribosyl-dephospho-CoA synthetase
MTVVDDTTVLHRHGPETLSYVRQKAAEILVLGGLFTAEGKSAILSLDEDFISRRISPGGSADLLAATYFLWLVEKNATV